MKYISVALNTVNYTENRLPHKRLDVYCITKIANDFGVSHLAILVYVQISQPILRGLIAYN